jgi:hypothetical protein
MATTKETPAAPTRSATWITARFSYWEWPRNRQKNPPMGKPCSRSAPAIRIGSARNMGRPFARPNRTASAGSTQNSDRYRHIASHPMIVMGSIQ